VKDKSDFEIADILRKIF